MARRETESVVQCMTGPPGVGKTFIAVEMLVQWLKDHKKGTQVYWSNLPLKVNEIGFFLRWDVSSRVQQIPEEVLKEWEKACGREKGDRVDTMRKDCTEEQLKEIIHSSGPWGFFAGKDIDGAKIMLDEGHKYISDGAPAWLHREWAVWLGEIRHRGAQVEFLSQDVDKISPKVLAHCASRVIITSTIDRLIPYTWGMVSKDWYELCAFITGDWNPAIWVQEQFKLAESWKTSRDYKTRLRSEIFALYNSYNVGEGEKGGKKVYEHEKGWRSFWSWFLKRNWFRLVGAVATAITFFGFFFMGGAGWAITKELEYFAKFAVGDGINPQMGAKPSKEMVASAPAAEVSPGSVASVQALGEQASRAAAFYAPVGPPPALDQVVGPTRGISADVRTLADSAFIETVEVPRLGGAGDVVFCDGDLISFRDGTVCKVGDIIADGPWKGRAVLMILMQGKRVILSGGLSLGFPRQYVVEKRRKKGDKPGDGFKQGAGAVGNGLAAAVN